MIIDKIDIRGSYWASEVTFNWGTKDECRVDFMKFEPINNSTSGLEKGIFICYEVKSSIEDYRSPNGHNFLGEKNYYVMPMDVWNRLTGKDALPSYNIGCYVPIPMGSDSHKEYENPTPLDSKDVKRWELKCVSKSRPVSRKYSNLTCLFNMFRSGH
jgi:hypothetical protein